MGNIASHATGDQTDGAGVGIVVNKGIESGCDDIGVSAAYDTESHGLSVLLVGYKDKKKFAIFAVYSKL